MMDPSLSDPAARLEAALERIARRAAEPPAPALPTAVLPDPALIARLDGLILQLQRALDGEDAADGPDQP